MVGTAEAREPDVLRYAAFTDDPGGGNPAGVVLDARGWSDDEMLATAAEVGYSETAFLVGVDHAARRYDIRYFSPLAEVAFCGHATVATAVALAERHGPGELAFDTPVGLVRIDTRTQSSSGLPATGRVAATFTSVETSTRSATPGELDRVLEALRWAPSDLDDRYPPHVAYAGGHHLVLAARTRGRLADLGYDTDALGALMAESDWTTVHLVWAESATVFHARDPFPPGGVYEDPATGAAAAAFAGYLRDLGLAPVPSEVVTHQGEDMGRPSLLVAELREGDRRVRVTGTAVPIS